MREILQILSYCAALILMNVALVGCETHKSMDRAEYTLERAFEALKERDWEGFSKLTVTGADLINQANGVGRFERGQSYAGAVLKPEEISKLRAGFDRTGSGGQHMIDFKNAEFVSIGSAIRSGDWPLLSGDSVPYTLYSLKIRSGGKELDTRELDPAFYVVRFGSFYKIIGLSFADEES